MIRTMQNIFYSTHSELNAILKLQGSLEGSKLYVTLFHVNECAKAIIQAGIKTIICGGTSMPTHRL